MNWLKELYNEMRSLEPFPYIKGYANLNSCKDGSHKKHIMRLLMDGRKLTAMGYATEEWTTKLSTRVSELINDYGMPIKKTWAGEGRKQYYEYTLDFNKLKEIK